MDNKVFFFFSHENLLLLQETSAVREVFREYQKAGTGTIRENTTQSIARDLLFLKQLSKVQVYTS